jgi:mono/diheme cytochrome c family protein
MLKILIFLALVFGAIQFIPYGKDHTNPPVLATPKFDSDKTKELFMRACGDCHSNETKWPWYSNIAPISWSVYHHVVEGREHFNVSAWGKQKKNEGEDAAKELEEGEMPLFSYLIAHGEARLSDEDKNALIEGLKKTFPEDDEHEKDED